MSAAARHIVPHVAAARASRLGNWRTYDADVLELLKSAPGGASVAVVNRYRVGVQLLADWLAVQAPVEAAATTWRMSSVVVER